MNNPTATAPKRPSLVGEPLVRVDGALKVTGRTRYATDRSPANVAYAALVTATISKGRIVALDTAAARAVPGVLLVATHAERRPAIRRVVLEMELTYGRRPHEDMPPLQSPDVHYAGQIVALVVAETLEIAREAAHRVAVEYERQPATVVAASGAALDFPRALPHALHIPKVKGFNTDETHGDPAAELAAAAVTLDATYSTPPEFHAAMELHGRVAEWQGDQLVMHEPTQWVAGSARALAQALGVPDESVRLVSPYVGGAFGGKAYFRYDAALCAWAARELARPVKLELTRAQVFALGGARPATRQRVQLGTDAAGALRAVTHDSWTAVSTVDTNYQETCGYQTRQLYATPSLRTTHRVVPFDIPTTCPMRAPGAGPGSFALESALDELAHKLGLDPLALRLRNYADAEPGTGRPFSAKHLRECYSAAAEQIGWSDRRAAPRTRRDGDWLLGLGMATASYDVVQLKARAAVALYPDGTAEVWTSANDIGTGAHTILTQIAADCLGLPSGRVACRTGDSQLPTAGAAAGQSQANSTGPAVALAAGRLVRQLQRLASADPASPVAGLAPARIRFAAGCLSGPGDGAAAEPFTEVLRRAGLTELAADAEYQPQLQTGQYSLQSWGAQFCEVGVHERTGEVRVRRVASAFDFGRVLNRRTAHSQLMGGIVFGIGMALLERGEYDASSGRQLNASLAEYLVPVSADVPAIQVTMLDRPDAIASPILGAKGCGEIGNVGIAAAIANAVFNATGVRVRDLPITLDKLLGAPEA